MAEYAFSRKQRFIDVRMHVILGNKKFEDSLYTHCLPITTLGQKLRKLLQVLLIRLIESIQDGAVNVNDCDDFISRYDRNHNLALALAVARNVTGELLHILD